MWITFWSAIALMSLFAWPYLKNLLSAAAQPIRLELADRGEAFLREPGVPPFVSERVRFMLDHAFGMRGVLLASIIFIGPISLAFLINPKWFARYDLRSAALDEGHKREFREIERLHRIVIFLNNPILTLLDSLLAVCVFGPALFLRTAIDGRFPSPAGVVWAFVDTSPRKLLHFGNA